MHHVELQAVQHRHVDDGVAGAARQGTRHQAGLPDVDAARRDLPGQRDHVGVAVDCICRESVSTSCKVLQFTMTRRLNVRQGVTGGIVISVVMIATSSGEAILPTFVTCSAAVSLVGLLAHKHNRRMEGTGGH